MCATPTAASVPRLANGCYLISCRPRSKRRRNSVVNAQLGGTGKVAERTVVTEATSRPSLGYGVKEFLVRLVPAKYQFDIVSKHLLDQNISPAIVLSNIEILCRLFEYSHHIRDLVCNHPQLLTADLVGWKGLLSLYDYDDADFASFMMRFPRVYSSKLGAGNAVAVLSILCHSYKVAPITVRRKIIEGCPEVLNVDVAHGLQPALKEIERIVGARDYAVQLVSKHPKLVLLAAYSATRDEMNKKIDYLHSLGLSKEDCKRILNVYPKLLLVSLEGSIKPKFKLLADQFGLKQDEVVSLVSGNPYILNISAIELRRKWRFLSVLQCTTQDLLECPAYLTTSIYDEVGPTYFYVTQKGCKEEIMKEIKNEDGVVIGKRVSLVKLLRFTADCCNSLYASKGTDSLAKRVSFSLSEYLAMKEQWRADVGHAWRTNAVRLP